MASVQYLTNVGFLRKQDISYELRIIGFAVTDSQDGRDLKSIHILRKGKPMFLCSRCPELFINRLQLKLHTKSHLENTIPSYKYTKLHVETTKQIDALMEYEVSDSDRPFSCTECDRSYTSRQTLKQHVLSKHRCTRYQCKYCSKNYSSPENLSRHVKTHDAGYIPEIHKCPVCDIVVSQKKSLQKHMQKHSENRDTYVCSVCGKEMMDATNYKYHMMKHNDEKPCVCSYCGKTFVRRDQLKVHERVHTKEKPYLCHICNASFTQRSSLGVHLKHHEGKRKFKCIICDRAFVTKTELKNHSKSHNKV